jgi:pilus assembly protein CpaE
MADPVASRPATVNPGLPRTRVTRLSVAAFVTDAATEAVLRDGLGDLVSEGLDIRRGAVRSVISAMMRMSAPEVLIVDISGQDRPLQALAELCDVIEPATRLLVLGDTDDVDLYRHIIRNTGAIDYIFKPVTLEMIGRQLAPLITRQSPAGDSARGGRVIAVMGARGGVGASMVAANLAWRLGVDSNRHTVLIDADMHAGILPDLLGAERNSRLIGLLDGSEAIVPGNIEDITQPVSARLHLLAGQLPIDDVLSYISDTARTLIEAFRLRYNFVVLDLPYLPLPSHRELLELAHHRLIVLDPSLTSLRDTLRLLGLSNGPRRLQRPTLVLNRDQRPAALGRKQIEEALKRKVDIVIPDLPRQLGDVQDPDSFAKLRRSAFGRAITDLSMELGFDSGRVTKTGQDQGEQARMGGLFRRFRKIA